MSSCLQSCSPWIAVRLLAAADSFTGRRARGPSVDMPGHHRPGPPGGESAPGSRCGPGRSAPQRARNRRSGIFHREGQRQHDEPSSLRHPDDIGGDPMADQHRQSTGGDVQRCSRRPPRARVTGRRRVVVTRSTARPVPAPSPRWPDGGDECGAAGADRGGGDQVGRNTALVAGGLNAAHDCECEQPGGRG